jgi:hypothetical protein
VQSESCSTWESNDEEWEIILTDEFWHQLMKVFPDILNASVLDNFDKGHHLSYRSHQNINIPHWIETPRRSVAKVSMLIVQSIESTHSCSQSVFHVDNILPIALFLWYAQFPLRKIAAYYSSERMAGTFMTWFLVCVTVKYNIVSDDENFWQSNEKWKKLIRNRCSFVLQR